MKYSNWIKTELEFISNENKVELFEIPSELILNSSLYIKLTELLKSPIFDRLQIYLAYVYQARNALAKMRENILNSELNVKTKLAESIKLYEDMMKLCILNEFANRYNLTVQGSTTIELGLNVVKNFQPIRQYILANIYLENIYYAILEFLEKHSNKSEIISLITESKYSKQTELISKRVFVEFMSNEKITSEKLFEATIGSELLLSAFKLSDQHMRDALLALIDNTKGNVDLFYVEIDKKISETLTLIGLSEDEIQKLTAKLMFLERRLC
ncbi:MAG TPA: hypothetical protein VKU94_07025 [Geobacterales bacterium]|nr:hypothetical protein [Geobacterales bacterium]